MRPRTPTEILKLNGTYRQDRHAGRLDAVALPGTLDKPGDLPPDAAGLWDLITATLPPGTLAAIDAAALTACCCWFARWRDLDRRLQAGDGDEYRLLTLACAAAKQFATLAGKFGLTPVDRAKLTTAPPAENLVSARHRRDGEPLAERRKPTPSEWRRRDTTPPSAGTGGTDY